MTLSLWRSTMRKKGFDLNRENDYRMNLGIWKSAFAELLGAVPKRLPAGGVVDRNNIRNRAEEIIKREMIIF